MAARILAALAVMAVVMAQHTPHLPRPQPGPAARAPGVHQQRAPAVQQQRATLRRPVPYPFGSQRRTYGYQTPRPAYRPQPTHRTYQATTPAYGSDEPFCAAAAAATNKTWCVEDNDYPTYEIQAAAEANADKLLSLYADVADLNTKLSVILPSSQNNEAYLCATEISYVRPLRAINTEGKWRIIVNGIKVYYKILTQTTRLEDCLTIDTPCPLVPQCIETKCLSKYIYHRFLVYDPYDQYFPFAVESFKLPASCGCLLREQAVDY